MKDLTAMNAGYSHQANMQAIPETPVLDRDQMRMKAMQGVEKNQQQANAEQYLKVSAQLNGNDKVAEYLAPPSMLLKMAKVGQLKAEIPVDGAIKSAEEELTIMQEKLKAYSKEVSYLPVNMGREINTVV